MDRKAVGIGEFYFSDFHILSQFIEENKSDSIRSDFISLIIPNGKYDFAGDILVKTLSSVNLPDTVILLGINHSGFGETISVWTKGSWETPFGNLEIDYKMASELIRCSDGKDDILAHVREYSIENILPVLKYLKPNIKIVPVSIMGMPLSKLRSFAMDLSSFALNGVGIIDCSCLEILDNQGKNTDDNNNNLIIDAILSVDGESLYEIVMDRGIMMEGVYPSSICLMSSHLAGASRGVIIEKKSGAVGVVIR